VQLRTDSVAGNGSLRPSGAPVLRFELTQHFMLGYYRTLPPGAFSSPRLRSLWGLLACGDLDTLWLFFHRAGAFTKASVTAFPALEVGDGFQQIDSAEVRP